MQINMAVPLVIALLMRAGSAQQIPANPPAVAVSQASKVFKEYDSGYTLDQLVASPQPDGSVLIRKTFDPRPEGGVFNPGADPSSYPAAHIRLLAATADFIGTGIPIKRWSYPTDDSQFLFSIYLVQVTEVVSSSSDNVSQGDYIFVARAGGILNYVGHDIVASDPEFQLSHLNEEYLFFGRRIGPDLYKVDSEHVLLLKNGLVAETTTHVRHPDLYGNISKSQLLREVYAAADLLKSNQTSPR